MIPKQEIITRLRRTLDTDLPGKKAQGEMIPESRVHLPVADELQAAAVLIALFPGARGWTFPLIRRVVDGYAHSGQVGLPGGRREGKETVIETALREAWEEVGIPEEGTEICGELSTLPIPVSKYRVRPVVSVLAAEPEWKLQPTEVDELLLVEVADLMDTRNIQVEQRLFQGKEWSIPYFRLADHKVWGATAMILSEFRAVLARAGLSFSRES